MNSECNYVFIARCLSFSFHLKKYIDELTKTDSSTRQTQDTHTHTPQEWKRKKRGSINSIELNGKRIESDIKCNTIARLNISWDYSGSFFFYFFNWFFARTYTHTSIASSNIDDSRVLNRRRHKFTHSIQNTQCDATACISLN